MNFLNPAILLGLAAATIPLLIHLLTRSKAKTIKFSTLQFLQEIQQQKVRRVQIRQILLLIIRTLIIICLVLAFSRPTLTSNNITNANAQTTAAIILDNSASMNITQNRTSLYESAQRIAKDIVSLMSQGDQIYLITTTDTSQQAGQAFHDFSVLLKKIDETSVDTKVTNLDAAITYANRLLSSSQTINKELYIISDFQKTAVQDTLTLSDDIRVYLHPLKSENIENISIENAFIKNSILKPGKIVELEIELVNHANHDIQNEIIQVYANDSRVAQTTASIPAHGRTTQIAKFILEKPGFLEGEINIDNDELGEDNSFYFSLYIPEKTNVLLCAPTFQKLALLQLALQPTRNNRFSTKFVETANFEYTNLDSFHVVCLSNAEHLLPNALNRLGDFVESGGGLLIIMDEDTDIREFNNSIAPALGLPQAMDALTNSRSFFQLGRIDFFHPAFTDIFENENPNFSRPNFGFCIRPNPRAQLVSLGNYSHGSPFLYENKLGDGAVITLTSGLGVSTTDISRKTIFAPMMTGLISYLASNAITISPYIFPGEEWTARLETQYIQQNLDILKPDDRFDHVAPSLSNVGPVLTYKTGNQPGVYKVLSGNNVINQFVVNIDRQEFDLEPVNFDTFLPNENTVIISNFDELGELVHTQRFGLELWKHFILAALLLLIFEMLLYREKGEVAVR